MINFLNIYKFSFPFIENKYEEVLFNSIFTDLKELFLYKEILINTDREEIDNTTKITLNLKNGKIELYFNKSDDYYIPKFQLNLFFKTKIDKHILIKLINIFEIYGLKNYIFDYDINYSKTLKWYKLKNIQYLENNFESYGEKELTYFLKNMHKEYLEEELKNNPIIFDSILYLIYISFIFYKNSINYKNIENEIIDLKTKSINNNYLGIIDLSKTRLDINSRLSLVMFKKYKKMVNVFFGLLK